MSSNIISFEGIKPKIDKLAFVANNAPVIGDVEILANSSIWYGCVIRGDVNYIKIGRSTNIQDGTIVHVSRNAGGQTIIGDHITIGHQCLIHACTIKNYSFIGMNSVIMDAAMIEEYSMVGAGSLITEGKIAKSGQLWLGRPAKYVRDLTDEEILFIKQSAENYCVLSKKYITNSL